MSIEAMRLAGRCANGFESDGGHRYHAVENGRALCGATPGRRSAGWAKYSAGLADALGVSGLGTCPRCAKKLAALRPFGDEK